MIPNGRLMIYEKLTYDGGPAQIPSPMCYQKLPNNKHFHDDRIRSRGFRNLILLLKSYLFTKLKLTELPTNGLIRQ